MLSAYNGSPHALFTCQTWRYGIVMFSSICRQMSDKLTIVSPSQSFCGPVFQKWV
uniref:Uncharacterized protein n=1 Tax=Arundo donax TaxID=35708 RepID=A0A0A9BY61_ARUDO